MARSCVQDACQHGQHLFGPLKDKGKEADQKKHGEETSPNN